MSRDEIVKVIKGCLAEERIPIPNSYIRNECRELRSVSPGAQLLFLNLYALRVSGEMCYEDFARGHHVTASTVRRWEKELTDKGLLKVEGSGKNRTRRLELPQCEDYELAKAWYFEEEKQRQEGEIK